MTGLDLSTKTGALRFCELRRAEMVGCFEKLGRFELNGYSFGAYVFATHEIAAPRLGVQRADPSEWRTGSKLDRVRAEICRLPKEVVDLLPPERHTSLFGHVMRSYTKITRAIGTLVMTEMWHVEQQGQPGKSAEEVRDELPDSLEDAPGRGEALYMQLEHAAAGLHVWTAEIKREPTRLGEWRERSEYGSVSGRLVDLAEWRS